jgi:hypothetical protein
VWEMILINECWYHHQDFISTPLIIYAHFHDSIHQDVQTSVEIQLKFLLHIPKPVDIAERTTTCSQAMEQAIMALQTELGMSDKEVGAHKHAILSF